MNKLQKATKMLSELYDMSSVNVFYGRHPLSPTSKPWFYLKFFGEAETIFVGEDLNEVEEFIREIKYERNR